MKVRPVLVSPESMLVTTTGPVVVAQVGNGPGRTNSSVADTEITVAGMPASETATGARNPCPKIVTGVNGASCLLLSIAVTWIAVTKRKAAVFVASRPELTSWTRTSTF